MGKHSRQKPLPADKSILKREIMSRYPHWWGVGIDPDFVVDQCYRDRNYLKKIEKLNEESENGEKFGGDNTVIQPIYKLSPGEPEYEEAMRLASANSKKVLESSAEKYSPLVKELDERTSGSSESD